jgi:formate dehydrogenase subunit delta
MNEDKLVRMANDIAHYFAAYGREEAVAEIRHHIEAFWPKRMRLDAVAALDAGEERFDPLVVAALRSLGSPPPPPPGEVGSSG